jgi:hypothetical protein
VHSSPLFYKDRTPINTVWILQTNVRKTACAALRRIFSSNKRAPAYRKKGFQTSHSKGIFVLSSKEKKRLKKYLKHIAVDEQTRPFCNGTAVI